jgi:hypothetical protein
MELVGQPPVRQIALDAREVRLMLGSQIASGLQP